VVNIALGLVFPFSQPVTKAMPPAIISVSGDLAKLNAWDLTCDKVGRYLAPIAYAVVSAKFGFRTALFLSIAFYALLTVLRMCVHINEIPSGDK